MRAHTQSHTHTRTHRVTHAHTRDCTKSHTHLRKGQLPGLQVRRVGSLADRGRPHRGGRQPTLPLRAQVRVVPTARRTSQTPRQSVTHTHTHTHTHTPSGRQADRQGQTKRDHRNAGGLHARFAHRCQCIEPRLVRVHALSRLPLQKRCTRSVIG